MDLLAFLRLLSGKELIALLRRVWGWARPAQHPTVSDLRAGSAPTSASAAASSTEASKNITGAASSTDADAKSVPGSASSPTADAKNADAKNRDATSSSLDDDANTKNRGKIADAASSTEAYKSVPDAKNRDATSSSLADPKNRAKLAEATNRKNRGMIADASSSLAANLRPTFRPFVAARATARASRSGSTTAVLFQARCAFCDWSGRVSMSVLFEHAGECRHERYAMELRLREARAEKKKAKAEAKRRRFKR